MLEFEFKGIAFDDVVEGEYNVWSQVCNACVEKHNIPKGLLDDAGQGICGVVGCENEADYYIDFPYDCSKCYWYTEEGGDWVPTPFGIDNVQTPIAQFCEHDDHVDDNDEQKPIVNEYFKGNSFCPHFRVK